MVPEGWLLQTIGDLAPVTSGGTPSRSNDGYWNGDIPWVTTAEVNYNTILRTAETISEEGLRRSAAKIFPAGTLLIAMYGQGKTRGKVARLGTAAATNQACAALLPSEKYHSDFLYHYLVSNYDALRSLSNDGSQKNLSGSLIRSIKVPAPPLPEQRKIAEILSTWDAAIETTEKLLATAEAQKRALMQLLLTGKRRLKGFEEREWRRVSLAVVFERVTRKNTTENTNALTISGREGLVSQNKYFSKQIAASDTSGYILLRGGEFAYNKSYSIGYPMGAIKMLDWGKEGILSSLYICFAVRNTSSDDHDFYRHWFEHGCLNNEIYGIAQEGARNHGLLNVGIADFFNLRIARPELDEQIAVANVINEAERHQNAVVAGLDKLRKEKAALMQQLLTGKRRVKV